VVALVLAASCGGSDREANSTSATALGENVPAVVHPAADRRPRGQGVRTTDVSMQAAPALDTGVPVAQGNFADPFLLVVGDVVYAYATNVVGANIPVLRSASSTEAVYLGDALPTLPAWTEQGAVWAPSVYARADGSYVLFYDSLYGITGHQCVSRAVAKDPAGPFVDDSTQPFVCPLTEGGAIDASMVTVDGQPWLVYKADGNCCDLPTSIWSVPLSDDLLSLAGTPTQLITADQGWEGGVVEAPEIVEVQGSLYLFYSGNDWNSGNYAVGYATCASMTGPCSKPSTSPLLAAGGDVAGPGGQTLVFTPASDSRAVVGYHGWLPGKVGAPGGERRLYVGEVSFADGAVSVIPYS
jgi:hypothetical protein